MDIEGTRLFNLRHSERLGDWRYVKRMARGFRNMEHGGGIVLVNGCFDILHPGHVARLEMSRELGHVLIVSVDHDDLVREAKGEGHPYMHFTDRMTVIAGLAPVGLVTWHGGTAGPLADLIVYLKPDIWACRPNVPEVEAKACQRARTTIVRIDRQGDYSSGEILARV